MMKIGEYSGAIFLYGTIAGYAVGLQVLFGFGLSACLLSVGISAFTARLFGVAVQRNNDVSRTALHEPDV